jgi:ABC-type tungstate transport system substrate-binding protein
MWIKVAIVITFLALVASLITGFTFLMSEENKSRQLWNSLAVRLALASLLIGLLIYGIYTGQLKSNAPMFTSPPPSQMPIQPNTK